MDGGLRMLDHFQMGPNLVRGFAPAGIGPRDLTQLPFTGVYGDALGGTYFGAPVWSCRRRSTSSDTGVPQIRELNLPRLPTRARCGIMWARRRSRPQAR